MQDAKGHCVDQGQYRACNPEVPMGNPRRGSGVQDAKGHCVDQGPQRAGNPEGPTGSPSGGSGAQGAKGHCVDQGPYRAGNPEEPKGSPRRGSNARYSQRHGVDQGLPESGESKPPETPRHWTQRNTCLANPHSTAAARTRLADKLTGSNANIRVNIRGLVCPRGRANQHPAAPMLREYAAKGCPVSVGRDWTLKELEAAAERGPHRSALEPDAIATVALRRPGAGDMR